MIILLFFSLLAGFVTVLSPCILPVLPVLLAAGVGQGRSRPLGIIIGLSVSFAFFTLTLTAIVQATGISPNFLRYVAITLITFFGLTMLFPKLGALFETLTSGIAHVGAAAQEKSSQTGTGFWSGLLLGGALGLLWTPCAGPILATITTLVATQMITWQTIAVTAAYSIGTSLPMFIIMYGGQAMVNSTQAIARHAETIRKVFGLLMIGGALAIAFHADIWLQQVASRYLSMLTVEHSQTVREALTALQPPSSTKKDLMVTAPDFVGITDWINSAPLSLKNLHGKVVLIDFWTYSCINCVRTLPYLKKWYETYKDKGFVVIGVHTPEFAFEKDLHNVQDAVKRFGITYPVALDNNYKTWLAYDNHYWPAHYLVDQHGIIQESHAGEGDYQETENAIRTLLGLLPMPAEGELEAKKPLTSETYLGYARADRYQQSIMLKQNQTAAYDYQEPLAADHVGLKGSWFIGPEFIQAQSGDAQLELNFIANRVYLVMQSPTAQMISVLLDNEPISTKYHTKDMNEQGQIRVSESRMYDIIDLKGDYGRHKLTLLVPKEVSLYAFTFGAGSD